MCRFQTYHPIGIDPSDLRLVPLPPALITTKKFTRAHYLSPVTKSSMLMGSYTIAYLDAGDSRPDRLDDSRSFTSNDRR